MGAVPQGGRPAGSPAGGVSDRARLLKLKSPMEIEKVYEPQRFEPHWAKWWVDERLFHVEPSPGVPYFSLAIPPPNVTGSLHMGHMFEHSIIDALIRWHRMCGE